MFKMIIPNVDKPLSFNIKKCLQAGIFPKFLKFAEIKPISKNGDRWLPEKYRPIAMLPAVLKVI